MFRGLRWPLPGRWLQQPAGGPRGCRAWTARTGLPDCWPGPTSTQDQSLEVAQLPGNSLVLQAPAPAQGCPSPALSQAAWQALAPSSLGSRGNQADPWDLGARSLPSPSCPTHLAPPSQPGSGGGGQPCPQAPSQNGGATDGGRTLGLRPGPPGPCQSLPDPQASQARVCTATQEVGRLRCHLHSWRAVEGGGPDVGSWTAEGPVTEQVTWHLRSSLSSECEAPRCQREASGGWH